MVAVLIDWVRGHVANGKPADKETQEGGNKQHCQRDAVNPDSKTQCRLREGIAFNEEVEGDPIENFLWFTEVCVVRKEFDNEPNRQCQCNGAFDIVLRSDDGLVYGFCFFPFHSCVRHR